MLYFIYKKLQNKHSLNITSGDIFNLIPSGLIKFIVDKEVRHPLNTVIKTSIERRFDALFELKDDSILHIEVQSYNDKKMPERMFEYYALLRSKYKNKNIIQKVLYVGDDKMKMSNELKTLVIKSLTVIVLKRLIKKTPVYKMG